MLIISVNPIHSLLFLVLIFLLTTCVFLLLKIEFISMLFLVVYLGAIIVLFLFVVMMLNIRVLSLNQKIINYIPISFFIFFGIFLEFLNMLNQHFANKSYFLTKNFFNFLSVESDNIKENNWIDTYNQLQETTDPQSMFNKFYDLLSPITNLDNIGIMLYTEYMHIFILGSIILLIGMLGAIILTLQNKVKIRQQNYYNQNTKNIFKSIKKIK